jgi:hypothetical protein
MPNAEEIKMQSLAEYEDFDYYVLGRDYFTHENLYHGKTSEKIVVDALKTKFKKRDGYMIKHNPFNSQYRYACAKGIDIPVYFEETQIAEIEVKGLADQPKPYGTDYVYRHILPRFSKTNCVKILVITYEHLLTKKAKDILEQHGIIIFEIGYRLTTSIYQNLKQLYSLGSALHKLIVGLWQHIKPTSQKPDFFNSLSYFLTTDTIDINDNTTVNHHQIDTSNIKYDTPIHVTNITDGQISQYLDEIDLIEPEKG